jgi:outer membrane lipoprotein SlyB
MIYGGGKMSEVGSQNRGYILAGILGAIGGGLIVTIATKAIPKMMSRMFSEMMGNMMYRMREQGCDPVEI